MMKQSVMQLLCKNSVEIQTVGSVHLGSHPNSQIESSVKSLMMESHLVGGNWRKKMDNRYAYSYTKSNGETRVLYSETPPSLRHEGVSDMSYSSVKYVEYPNDKEEKKDEVYI